MELEPNHNNIMMSLAFNNKIEIPFEKLVEKSVPKIGWRPKTYCLLN